MSGVRVAPLLEWLKRKLSLPAMPARNLAVITMGRVSVDLYPEQIGRGLRDVESFSKSLGGSPTNVAVGAARLGTTTAVITKVGNDPFGGYIRRSLEEFGVDPTFVSTDPGLRTPLAFCEIHPPNDFPLFYYREPMAPDMNLSYPDLPVDHIVDCDLFWTTGVGLSDEPSRSSTVAAMEIRSRASSLSAKNSMTVHDIDYRPMLWRSPEEARHQTLRAVRYSTVVVGNTEEVEMATGTTEPTRAAAVLIQEGAEVAIIKRGAEGVIARSASGEAVEVPPCKVDVRNGLGAGDAFGGALCHGLVSGWKLERTLRFANAAGAIVASRMRCADDMPTIDEVESLLGAS